MNFLPQVRGHKTVKLWDPLDLEITNAEQRDRLLSYDGGRPTSKPSFESKAQTFELAPGLGVHHPLRDQTKRALLHAARRTTKALQGRAQAA